MTNRFARGHRDANEGEITAVLRLYGVPYFLLSEGAGADILVMLTPMELWEVKNPAQPPSGRELTETERVVKGYCDEWGIPYFVLQWAENAVERITRRLAEMEKVEVTA